MYAVLGVNPLKVVEVCHVPAVPRRYSQPLMVLSIMLVGVADERVGAAGAVWFAFATATVASEVTLPLQVDEVTTTLSVLPMSACTGV